MTTDLPVHDWTDYGIKLVEEERRRIARDLHDGPAQALVNLSMRLEIIQQFFQTNPQMAMQELERANRRLISVVNELRRLIYDLRPVVIDEKGLVGAVADLCERAAQDWNLRATWEAPEGFVCPLSPAKQVGLYRLVQEAFNNVHKHAEASSVHVRMGVEAGHFFLEVRDDGRGFRPEDIPPGHYGLAGMRERAHVLGGTLEVKSQVGAGTTVTVRIPLSRPAVLAGAAGPDTAAEAAAAAEGATTPPGRPADEAVSTGGQEGAP
ncbi:hypothetical protein GCM10010885_12690 [Alicyclobacillus cellulosilyticus]|uniref:histidine kinase n=1 Tax=Alicyclobacillus cellulosilyticus TaxID=1003997 RepID=A0A917K9A4_9BACL|nr:sensor histidine kinase [Alicyclobacillus cellulosilyticus]GGJ05008.1 hypothetical protein GCM10010885_12690 [Alicyclobacillus cellulosilyticus]